MFASRASEKLEEEEGETGCERGGRRAPVQSRTVRKEIGNNMSKTDVALWWTLPIGQIKSGWDECTSG